MSIASQKALAKIDAIMEGVTASDEDRMRAALFDEFNTPEIIERMARGIYFASRPKLVWSVTSETLKGMYRKQAEAALNALFYPADH